jgi:hypothetical protein
MFTTVVLPEPLGPRSAYTLPSGTSRSTPVSTWLSPYLLWSPVTDIAGFLLMRTMLEA